MATGVWWIPPRPPLLPPSLPQGGAGHSSWQKPFIFGLAAHNVIPQTLWEFVALGAVPLKAYFFPTRTPLPMTTCELPFIT